MAAAVDKTGQSLEVVRMAVKRVIIPMMDLVTFWNWTINSLIHHPV
jgi:hypothetical protein